MFEPIRIPLTEINFSDSSISEPLKKINELLLDKEVRLISVSNYLTTSNGETGLIFSFSKVDKGDDYTRIHLG